MEVSIYIPCFNAAKIIQFCLEAIFEQNYPLKEVLVVDDGSTDKTAETVSRYPVRLIRHKANLGLAATRNTAIRNMNTEFIASLDADCVPEPNWLKHLMERLDSTKIVGAGGKLLETYSSTLFDFWRSAHMKQYWSEDNRHPPFLFGSNSVYRKEILIKVGLYNERYRSNYEDVEICQRIKKAGYNLYYDDKATVHHLKEHSLYSILDDYWKWNLPYYVKKKFYINQKNLIFKVKDNLGLANRYIKEDFTSKRYQLLYLDFLLVLHHSLRDFEYFYFQNNQLNYSILSIWLSLLDLTFFYHFDSAKNNLSTLMPKENTFLQNFTALNLILGKFIKDNFRNKNFPKILYKHLFLSICKTNDSHLLDRLLNLAGLQQDWYGLFKKKQPNLNALFLENLLLSIQKWLRELKYQFPGIIQMIEFSAEKTERLCFLGGEGCNNENK